MGSGGSKKSEEVDNAVEEAADEVEQDDDNIQEVGDEAGSRVGSARSRVSSAHSRVGSAKDIEERRISRTAYTKVTEAEDEDMDNDRVSIVDMEDAHLPVRTKKEPEYEYDYEEVHENRPITPEEEQYEEENVYEPVEEYQESEPEPEEEEEEIIETAAQTEAPQQPAVSPCSGPQCCGHVAHACMGHHCGGGCNHGAPQCGCNRNHSGHNNCGSGGGAKCSCGSGHSCGGGGNDDDGKSTCGCGNGPHSDSDDDKKKRKKRRSRSRKRSKSRSPSPQRRGDSPPDNNRNMFHGKSRARKRDVLADRNRRDRYKGRFRGVQMRPKSAQREPDPQDENDKGAQSDGDEPKQRTWVRKRKEKPSSVKTSGDMKDARQWKEWKKQPRIINRYQEKDALGTYRDERIDG